jgi:DegV family protein with EDD domain
MTVKVVTDSTSDIPASMANALGVRIVPIYVRFGGEAYRDGVDISADEFYERLVKSPVHPATSQPSPADFTPVYSELAEEAEAIVSIHISSRISGTYDSALLARETAQPKGRIEVIDSKLNSVGLALVVIAAARLASQGAGVEDVLAETHRAVDEVKMFGMFATMKYLALGGRVPRSVATTASILKVMPLLTFREGEIIRAGLVRTVSKGMDRLYEWVHGRPDIVELGISHSMVPEQAEELKKRLGSLVPEERIQLFHLGAALGVHGGPGVVVIGLRQSV